MAVLVRSLLLGSLILLVGSTAHAQRVVRPLSNIPPNFNPNRANYIPPGMGIRTLPQVIPPYASQANLAFRSQMLANSNAAYAYANNVFPYYASGFGWPGFYNPFGYNPYGYNPYALYGNPYGQLGGGIGFPGSGVGGFGFPNGAAFGPGPGVFGVGGVNDNVAPEPPPNPKLTAEGIPSKGNKVEWPLAFRLMTPTDRQRLLVPLEGVLLSMDSSSAKGVADATRSVEKLRHWLDERRDDMAEGTRTEARAFLQNLDRSLRNRSAY